MCIRINKIIFVIGLLFLCSISYSSDLPECPGSPYDQKSNVNPGVWHNCTGLLKFRDGTTYQGGFQNSAMHGNGTLKIINGNTYSGAFEYGKRNGYGTQWFNNGDKYVGFWKDEFLFGNGTYYWASGEVWEGEWDKGKYIEVSVEKFIEDSFVKGKKFKPGEYAARNREREIDNNDIIEEDTNSDILDIEEAKASCKDIGFKEGTEKFGECVLELTK